MYNKGDNNIQLGKEILFKKWCWGYSGFSSDGINLSPWVEVEGIMLGAISQSEKDNNHMTSLI